MKSNKKLINKNRIYPWLFIAPSLIGVMVLFVIPYIDIIKRSLFSSFDDSFYGIEKYRQVISNNAFEIAVKNTFRFMLGCIPLLLLLSLIIAVYVYNNNRIGRYLKTIFLLPMAIPVASIVLLWRVMFSGPGLFSSFVYQFGIHPRNWMDSQYSFWIIVFSYIWKNLGYNIVLWIAGLSQIPDSIYEASRIDGANRLQEFRYITLPHLKTSFFIITVISLINSFKIYREVYLIAGNYPNEKIYMIQNLFNNWFMDLNIDNVSAAAVLVGAVIFVLVLILKKIWTN